MKKILVLFVVFMSCQMAVAQSQNGWDNWQKTSCYSKIAFRLKDEGMRGEQHVWKVQFRNDNAGIVSFNYHVTDKVEQYETTTHRKVLNAGQVSDETEVFTAGEDIFILVDKVSLSAYPKDFINCN